MSSTQQQQQPWDISEKNYSPKEREQLWGTSSARLTTHCWMSLVLRNGTEEELVSDCNESIVPIKSNDSVKKIHHAESIALSQIGRILPAKIPEILLNSNESSILDLAIWITNSPCNDCKELITNKLRYLQSALRDVSLRLLLFFSSLYLGGQSSSDIPIDQMRDWLLSLVEMKISVIVGPIIVSKAVLKPSEIRDSKTHKIEIRKKRDIHSLSYIRKLKRKILSSQSTLLLNVFHNHKALSSEVIDENILGDITGRSLLYFSLTLPARHQLGKLNPIIGLFCMELVCLLVCLFIGDLPR